MVNREKAIRDFRTKFNITRSENAPDELIIEGYFALYENETELWPGCFEIITKGAFDNTLGNDIRALWNHNSQYVLGRTSSSSLELKADEKGLWGRCKLPNTQYARDLYELINRGDVDQCSFGFSINDETLEELADGNYRWRINDIDLHEVSVVTFPAYENTSIQARHKQIDEMKNRQLETKRAEFKKRLEAIKC